LDIAAALLFALALLASGQSASIVATVAGQSVSEGFLNWKVSVSFILSSDENHHSLV
jgi:NRAMP (natural resistance-associated macrophage protein)-like metal ion transporter